MEKLSYGKWNICLTPQEVLKSFKDLQTIAQWSLVMRLFKGVGNL